MWGHDPPIPGPGTASTPPPPEPRSAHARALGLRCMTEVLFLLVVLVQLAYLYNLYSYVCSLLSEEGHRSEGRPGKQGPNTGHPSVILRSFRPTRPNKKTRPVSNFRSWKDY